MKMPVEPYKLPPDKQEKLRRAKRLEWVTILFMLTIIAAISATMGASQTMKAMWTEDVLSLVPPVVLGRMKLPLARELHEKALQTDADINKGDWLAGLAAVLGITGIAFGFWWADAVAAGLISFEIVRDGYGDLRNSVSQLMNRRPTDMEGAKDDPVPDKIQRELERLDWVEKARVR